MNTLQTQFNQILEGKGNKEFFLKQARNLFPDYITKYNDFDTTISILKGKSIISEGIINDKTSNRIENYIKTFKTKINESVKAEEKKTSKEVEDIQKHAFDNKNLKNIDNLNFNEVLRGFYYEMGLKENKDKNLDELKAIVVKNLAKDPLYYNKEGMFGIEGVGFTDKAPGLGTNTQPKDKNSTTLGGMDKVNSESKIVKNSANEAIRANTKDTLSEKESKDSMPKGVKTMETPGKEKKIKLSENKFDPNKKYWDEGYNAFKNGESLENNPYNNNISDEYTFWERGWEQARKDKEGMKNSPYYDFETEEDKLSENENPFQEEDDSPFFRPEINYDELEALEQELQLTDDPEKKAEIEGKIKALEKGLYESESSKDSMKEEIKNIISSIDSNATIKITDSITEPEKNLIEIRYEYWKKFPEEITNKLKDSGYKVTSVEIDDNQYQNVVEKI